MVNLVKDHGSGIWFTIHFKAYKAVTPRDCKDFLKFIYDLAADFPCEECAVHFNEYLKKKPPSHEWGKVYNLNNGKTCTGLFYWTWEFHDAVDERIGHERITIEEAHKLYSEGQKCDGSCTYIPPGTSYKDFMRSYNMGLLIPKPI